MKVEKFKDNTEIISSAELALLREIADKSSDMVKARYWEEFRGACGGQEKLNQRHENAVHAYESWVSEGN